MAARPKSRSSVNHMASPGPCGPCEDRGSASERRTSTTTARAGGAIASTSVSRTMMAFRSASTASPSVAPSLATDISQQWARMPVSMLCRRYVNFVGKDLSAGPLLIVSPLHSAPSLSSFVIPSLISIATRTFCAASASNLFHQRCRVSHGSSYFA